jgi:hypothetical protein
LFDDEWTILSGDGLVLNRLAARSRSATFLC